MERTILIGSRESALAVAQADLVRSQIERAYPRIRMKLVTVRTTGDRILNRSLEEIGGKGLFVKELDCMLREGTIDIAVHSLKDLPMELPEDLPVLAYSKREDPKDALICGPGQQIFPVNGVLGTSSRRRAIQMKRLYPECSFQGIRGNVQTRLRKLSEGPYDGTILAIAGLKRLGMETAASRIFSVDEMIPAAGQGILAVQGRRGGDYAWLDCINDKKSEQAALAERQFVRTLDGGCTSPVAAYAQIAGRELKLTGLYCTEDRETFWTDTIMGTADRAEWLGEQLAAGMRQKYS